MSYLNGSTSGNGTGQGGPSTAPANLSSLLLQANSLSRGNGTTESDLPQIRYGLDEIERLSDNLGNKSKRKGTIEGHSLLTNLGVNTSQLNHSISHFAPPSDSRPKRRKARLPKVDPGADDFGVGSSAKIADVGAWGRNWHETIILSGIEYQRQRTVKAFNDQFQARLLSNWEMDKRRILQDELGVTDDDLAQLSKSSLGQSSLGKSALGQSTRKAQATSAIAREGEIVMHTKMTKYGQVVSDLNVRRLRREPFELCQAFEEASKGDAKHSNLPTAFRILAHLTYEPSLSDTINAPPVSERQYAKAYRDKAVDRAGNLASRLVAGGRRFLEKDFETHMDEIIARFPKDAAMGGVPGIENKVRGYVNALTKDESKSALVKSAEKVNDIKIWAQAYYLLRSGYPNESLHLITSHQNHLNPTDRTFPGAFQTYVSSPDRRIPKQIRDALLSDFNGNVRTNPNVDQFKYALYKIIGRFELNKKTAKVAMTTEDWIWLNLTLVSERPDDGPQDKFTMDDFGSAVLGYGSDRFDQRGVRPFAWSNLLLFAGQFERAIGYLYQKPQLRTDAVHLAIALEYYGLLRIAHPEDPIVNDGEIASFNFARAIKTYISPIARVEPQTALQYAYLVALGSDVPGEEGKIQKRQALDLVRDVVLASQHWAKLLGSVRADGTKQSGLIERDLGLLGLSTQDDYFKQIVLSAAEQSTLEASLVDSIELYHLAGSPDKVVETVNKALGSSLALPTAAPVINQGQGLGISGAFGGTQDLFGLAKRVHAVYEADYASRNRVARANWEVLGVLLKLKEALEQYSADRPDLAYETFRSTHILPLDSSDSSTLSRSTSAFKTLLDNSAITSLDEVVVTAMKCLHQLNQQLRQSPYGDAGRQERMETLKQQARMVVQFASGLRLRLGADVYRQLSSMSAFF